MIALLESLGPELRIAIFGAAIGALLNLAKRLPQVPSDLVPLASLALGALLTFGFYLASQLDPTLAGSYTIEALTTGALPIAGHKSIRALWVRLLSEESADKYLGQADGDGVTYEDYEFDVEMDYADLFGDDDDDDKPSLEIIRGGKD